MDIRIISNYIELYIRINVANSSNSNCELSELKTELTQPTPSNFRIWVIVELRTANSNPNWLNCESGNYGPNYVGVGYTNSISPSRSILS